MDNCYFHDLVLLVGYKIVIFRPRDYWNSTPPGWKTRFCAPVRCGKGTFIPRNFSIPAESRPPKNWKFQFICCQNELNPEKFDKIEGLWTNLEGK